MLCQQPRSTPEFKNSFGLQASGLTIFPNFQGQTARSNTLNRCSLIISRCPIETLNDLPG
jgi:hypothetical protein